MRSYGWFPKSRKPSKTIRSAAKNDTPPFDVLEQTIRRDTITNCRKRAWTCLGGGHWPWRPCGGGPGGWTPRESFRAAGDAQGVSRAWAVTKNRTRLESTALHRSQGGGHGTDGARPSVCSRRVHIANDRHQVGTSGGLLVWATTIWDFGATGGIFWIQTANWFGVVLDIHISTHVFINVHTLYVTCVLFNLGRLPDLVCLRWLSIRCILLVFCAGSEFCLGNLPFNGFETRDILVAVIFDGGRLGRLYIKTDLFHHGRLDHGGRCSSTSQASEGCSWVGHQTPRKASLGGQGNGTSGYLAAWWPWYTLFKRSRVRMPYFLLERAIN